MRSILDKPFPAGGGGTFLPGGSLGRVDPEEGHGGRSTDRLGRVLEGFEQTLDGRRIADLPEHFCRPLPHAGVGIGERFEHEWQARRTEPSEGRDRPTAYEPIRVGKTGAQGRGRTRIADVAEGHYRLPADIRVTVIGKRGETGYGQSPKP